MNNKLTNNNGHHCEHHVILTHLSHTKTTQRLTCNTRAEDMIEPSSTVNNAAVVRSDRADENTLGK